MVAAQLSQLAVPRGKFDKKIVTYVNSNGKGYKEDFVWEELEAAIELYEENKEEDK